MVGWSRPSLGFSFSQAEQLVKLTSSFCFMIFVLAHLCFHPILGHLFVLLSESSVENL